MAEIIGKIQEAKAFLQTRLHVTPQVGIILGTGLGSLSKQLKNQQVIEYQEIPNFAKTTVTSHSGQLIAGELSGVKVIVMEGRFHYYEGYSLEEVTFPVRVMAALGVGSLIVTNACGGLNPLHARGDIMVIDDHINLMGVNPLIGVHDDRLGSRFPDMSEPYCQAYISLLEKVALRSGVQVRKGVYAAMTGPCLETRAEYRMLQRLGADAIGMSTVPEVIVAVQSGLKVLGLSVITDQCLPDTLKPVSLEEIIAVATKTGPVLEQLILEFLAEAFC